MIKFRSKSLEVDLIDEAIKHLEKEHVSFKIIEPDQADKASKVNSKSMVLMSFLKTEKGSYQITVKDKEFYPYTQKLIGGLDYLNMRITDTDKKKRTVTGETDHLGVALDIIEILAVKYDLSIVKSI